MQQNSSRIKILFGEAENFEEMEKLRVKKIFDEDVCDFLNELSTEIRKDKEAKKFPDVVTFGFFCRKANLSQLKEQYMRAGCIGRGLSWHIAPSNVPINFAYSLVTGLLSGNACIVKVSGKKFVQTEILCRLMKKVQMTLKSEIGKYIAVIQYDNQQEINDYFSSICHSRVIWGGNDTIERIRKSPIQPRCVEIAFANRYSLCVMYADEIVKIRDWERIAKQFYNDTYLYDQNACSSPRILYWLGNKAQIEAAKKVFWHAIHEFTDSQYEIEPVIAVDKLVMDYKSAIAFEHVELEADEDNLFHRISIQSLPHNLPEYVCPGGSFFEYGAERLDDLAEIVTPEFQTLSYLGGNATELLNWVTTMGLTGIDRIVPMGETADFSLTWDGYNLIETMSRQVTGK